MATQCTITRKKPARHFADGGAVSKADQLMAEMAAKYGVTGQAQAAPVQQPAPQPQPKAQPLPQQQGIGAGIIGVLKGRAQQIDKAAGYSNGGKPGGGLIVGPGTAKSDSIPARVRETGEQIDVSNTERIVSAEQDAFLETVAKSAGYESLDSMFEDAGLPVGPTIKAGKRAAADGLAPDDDPFAYRGGKELGTAGPVNGPDSTALGPSAGITVLPGKTSQPAAVGGVSSDRINTAITAPPTLGSAPLARSEPVGTMTGPAAGLTVDPTQKPGRDASGIITADSAKGIVAEPMQRSGGVFGTMDMKGVNGILERENKARGEMIDSMVKANGGKGIAILGGDGPTETDKINAERTTRWRQDDLLRDARNGNQVAVGAALHANAQTDSEALRTAGAVANEQARGALVQRGQDIGLQRAAERNDVLTRGQDMRSGTAADRIASNEAIADARIAERAGRAGQLTTPQLRTNAEIEASRKAIEGLTPEEIKHRTANFTATGRENPDYDPTLAKVVSQANRRMYGETDDWFDNLKQPKQPTGTDGDVMTRFRADQGMKGHTTGKQTENGIEVFDAAGKLIGHYR